MKCKACDAELEEGVTLCPNCGFDNKPEQEEPVEQMPDEAAAEMETVEETTENPVTEENEDDTAEAALAEEPVDAAAQQNEPTPIVEGKLGAGKIALLVVLAVVAIAVVVALVVGGLKGKNTGDAADDGATTAPVETTEPTIPADGNPDDATCKGTYTVTDDEIQAQGDKVVATLGDAKLTNSELQVYYWMQVYDFLEHYGQYASMFGMDVNVPLDMQKSMDPALTWQQFFVREAVNSWTNYKALSMKAQAEGFVMDGEYAEHLEKLPATLEETAKNAGFETVEDMIRSDMGAGATLEAYTQYMNDYYKGYLYYGSHMDTIDLTDEEIEAYFDKHVEDYGKNGLKKDDSKLVDVRHILIKPEGGTTDEEGKVTYSEEEWEACKNAAQAVLDEYLAGEQTQERFAELAGKYSQDPGSAANGGLYAGVREGQMVKPFEEWSFDNSRVAGDYGLVKTDYGYHVMYYVDSHLVWSTTAERDLLVEKGNEYLKGVVAEYPMEVDYGAMALGLVELGK